MKGSSSAKLPKLNTGYLVETQQDNLTTNKRQKKGHKSLKKKRSVPQYDERSENTGKKSLKKPPKAINLDKVKVTEQDDSKSLLQPLVNDRSEDPHTMKTYKLYEDTSGTSLEQRRLVSAKTREHLLSLMPTQETYAEILKNEEFLWTAKQEIDRLRKRFDKGKHVTKDNSSKKKSICLLEQAKRAAKINKSILGSRDCTNNCKIEDICDIVFGIGSSKYQSAENTTRKNEMDHTSYLCSDIDAVNGYMRNVVKRADNRENIEHEFYN